MKRFIHLIIVSACVIVTCSDSFGQLNKRYFFNQGRYLVGQEQYAEAIAMLNQLIRADSTIAEAWFLSLIHI